MFFELFFFKQKTAYEIGVRLVGSEMCIRDSLYGGSVNLSNISEILELQFVNGVLVGSASTKASFINYFK